MGPLPLVVAALALVLVHLLAGRLRIEAHMPRSRWLSFASGVPTAFVFVELLPALAASQQRLTEVGLEVVPTRDLYLIALVGLLLHLGVERATARKVRDPSADPRKGTFWFAILSFALLNAMLGHLLTAEDRGPVELVLFSLGVALKFFVSDHALYRDHRQRYQHMGRWVLVGAFLLGWTAGIVQAVPATTLDLLRAFLVGSILLAVLKEELPAERQSRWWAFFLGAGIYTSLVLTAHALGRA